jgi:hypothetical protein
MMRAAILIILTLIAGWALQSSPAPQARSDQRATVQTATGKVTTVFGQTFSIQVGEEDNKESMAFVMDANTRVSGDLKVGSVATVEFRPGPAGENTATRVSVRPAS